MRLLIIAATCTGTAMSLGHHEDFGRHDAPKVGSDRGFGLVFAGVFTLIAMWPVLSGALPRWWALAIAGAFAMVTVMWPQVLAPLKLLWFRFGLLLHAVVNPLVMALLFFAVVTPTGLLMRAVGNDPLRLRREPNARSYWIERQPPGPAPETMRQQF